MKAIKSFWICLLDSTMHPPPSKALWITYWNLIFEPLSSSYFMASSSIVSLGKPIFNMFPKSWNFFNITTCLWKNKILFWSGRGGIFRPYCGSWGSSCRSQEDSIHEIMATLQNLEEPLGILGPYKILLESCPQLWENCRTLDQTVEANFFYKGWYGGTKFQILEEFHVLDTNPRGAKFH